MVNLPNTKWEKVYQTLLKIIPTKEEKDILDFFIVMNDSYRFLEEDPLIEPSQIKLLRSYIQVKEKAIDYLFLQEIIQLKEIFEKEQGYGLPTYSEYYSNVVVPFQPYLQSYPFLQIGLTFTNPIAFSNKIALNIICRCFDIKERLRFKIKIGVYLDYENKLFWETGCVFTNKGLTSISKNLSLLDVIGPNLTFTLKYTADTLMKLMIHKPQIEALDLTPAFFHIIPLCLRARGEFIDSLSFDEYKQRLLEAVQYSILNYEYYMRNINTPLYLYVKSIHQDSKKLKPIFISLLLYNKMVINPRTKTPFIWISPRIIRNK